MEVTINAKNVKRICTFCDKRHYGCGVDNEKFEQMIHGNRDCDEFVLGKCFYCIVDQENNEKTVENLCAGEGDVFYPQGCSNFKPGSDYDDYLDAVAEDNACFEEEKCFDRGIYFDTEKERLKAANRRKSSRRYHNRMIRKAKENKGWLPGPYYDEDIGRVRIWQRGKRSRWLKQQAHRRVRRVNVENDLLYQHGQHKRLFDYWWELI